MELALLGAIGTIAFAAGMTVGALACLGAVYCRQVTDADGNLRNRAYPERTAQ